MDHAEQGTGRVVHARGGCSRGLEHSCRRKAASSAEALVRRPRVPAQAARFRAPFAEMSLRVPAQAARTACPHKRGACRKKANADVFPRLVINMGLVVAFEF